MDLCNEDVLKMNDAINMKVTQALTYLAYKTSKNNMIQAIRKEEETKSKYRR
jgi:hypothetical protein